MWSTFLDWLTKYEAVAIWLEGIALVLIFGLDWWNARIGHRETLEQLRLSRLQAESLQSSVQSVVNSERAWIMAELAWHTHKMKPGPILGASQHGQGEAVLSTSVGIQLKCKNEGRTPGWIYEIRGHMEIISAEKGITSTEPPENLEEINGFVGPIGSGGNREGYVEFRCPGHPQMADFLSLYVAVRYHDIFSKQHETRLSYVIDSGNSIYRQDALTERNKNL
jgi:hypothetical protein